MTDRLEADVAIVGAGPAGLTLARCLELASIDSIIIESRTRAQVEQRQRAGVLEADVARLLRDIGAGARMDALAQIHTGINVQFEGRRHRIDFEGLVGGHVVIWPQTEIVRDLIALRAASGQPIEFGVTDVDVARAAGDGIVRCRRSDGTELEIRARHVAGCDGFHGPTRRSIPSVRATIWETVYPAAWLGVLAEVPPSADELIYARHERGFALHSQRSKTISRFYLQVPTTERLESWSDDRIWSELVKRLSSPGWSLREGAIVERSISELRCFVFAPMRHGRLFLAGDAAHIVPPTGAKGLNLAVADAVLLARTLTDLHRRATDAADQYSSTALGRAWRYAEFAASMTQMFHVGIQDAFEEQLALARLRFLASSPTMAAALARQYTGEPLPELG